MTDLTFKTFSRINYERSREWTDTDQFDWTSADWMIALIGEVGEACNIMKKLQRASSGMRGNNESILELQEALRAEVADIMTYLALFASHNNIDLEAEVISKFNAVSRKHGFSHILPESST